MRHAGATLHCGVWASHCSGFSCCRAWALGAWVSVVVAHRLSSCGSRALEYRLSSCGTRALFLHSMWDLPGPGLEPMSLALAGGFLTTAPPGKSLHSYLFIYSFFHSFIHSFMLRWVFVAVCGFSPAAASGGYSSLRCVGFSLQWLLLLSMGSRHSGFSSCGTWAQ